MTTTSELQQWLTNVYYRDYRQQVLDNWQQVNLNNRDIKVVRQGIIPQIIKSKLEYKETL